MAPPVVLTIAGFDPSSGAGVTADIKTLAAHGCYGVACITALTVQSTRGVAEVHPADPEAARRTLEALAADFAFAAVRIGMLGSGGMAEAVADFLERSRPANVVLDPVLRSSSGAALLDAHGQRVLVQRLLTLADVVTPNAAEAAALSGLEVGDAEGMRSAARRLHELGAKAVVITGGDWAEPMDLFSPAEGPHETWSAPRLPSSSTHGTGCAFATAIAANLALGKGLGESVVGAREFVRAAIAHAHKLGHGAGPVNHLFRWEKD